METILTAAAIVILSLVCLALKVAIAAINHQIAMQVQINRRLQENIKNLTASMDSTTTTMDNVLKALEPYSKPGD